MAWKGPTTSLQTCTSACALRLPWAGPPEPPPPPLLLPLPAGAPLPSPLPLPLLLPLAVAAGECQVSLVWK